ncbi:VPS10 domain-containing protein [Eisenibacter elegans]|uniref:VPS10 domain-containing protein n=1 Tax=Eisenibacter elegans TaxID=997 RepID=UPI0004129F6F|nr:glycosyl hydrolase [Eisenibacter elegans]
MKHYFYHKLLCCTLFCYVLLPSVYGQQKKSAATTSEAVVAPAALQSLQWRNIGPFRGGRSAAVTGVRGKPNVFFFGATGGGVWKSIDAGGTWRNISDGFFGGSIGAVAISESDPNILYVGGGEKTVRGNVSHGDGMWKSEDGGKTWRFIGLADSRHITRIRIHPKNPNIVYAAVLGHLFGPNQERGVYRSTDGGNTWQRLLFVNNQSGAVDLRMDPSNPRVLYAATWRVIRTPYSLESGGEGSGLWKSTDGGDTWTELTKEAQGLPKGTLGIIGVTVSPANPNRVWAIIEAHDGGVFRSDDAGQTWKKINEDRSLRQRAWYYTRIEADPKNPDVVYVLNVQFHRSKDGGRTYETISTPHSDHHDLWIDPDDPERMIIADDGGAQVSMDGGQSWSTYHNQSTAQMYRIAVDNYFPYRIYGGQQDNTALRISSQSNEGGITESHWQVTAGGESAHIAPHPTKHDIVYGTSYGGYLTRYDHAREEERSVDVYPDNPIGHPAKNLKYRFQWNFPIAFSPHDENILYTAANVLFKTTNEGQTWTAISPDLTRNDTTRMGASGGPITKDNTSVEYYGTIFAFAESKRVPGLIWTGSDDGLIHLTRDGGQTWINVTPKQMPEWMMINSIDPDPFNDGGVYVAGTRYKSNDFTPYLYKTTDYGKTWTLITQGIAPDHFTRVVRADPARQGLLYAGTERGVYVSWDDGKRWQPLQLNLPIVPITDLAVKENDLIAATQGRGYWILDDLHLLQTAPEAAKANKPYLHPIAPTYNTIRSGYGYNPLLQGQNPPNGLTMHLYLPQKPDTSTKATLEILDAQGQVLRTLSTHPPQGQNQNKLSLKQGANMLVWNMRYDDALLPDGMILWAGGTQGARTVPGKYQARLTIGGEVLTQPFEVLRDPRSEASETDAQAQLQFVREIHEKLNQTHQAILHIREMRTDLQRIAKQFAKNEQGADVVAKAKEIEKQITAIEEALYQTKNRSGQDPLNYPIRLNNKLSALVSLIQMGNHRPTDGMLEVKQAITAEIDQELAKWQQVLTTEVPAFNTLVKSKDFPALATPQQD